MPTAAPLLPATTSVTAAKSIPVPVPSTQLSLQKKGDASKVLEDTKAAFWDTTNSSKELVLNYVKQVGMDVVKTKLITVGETIHKITKGIEEIGRELAKKNTDRVKQDKILTQKIHTVLKLMESDEFKLAIQYIADTWGELFIDALQPVSKKIIKATGKLGKAGVGALTSTVCVIPGVSSACAALRLAKRVLEGLDALAEMDSEFRKLLTKGLRMTNMVGDVYVEAKGFDDILEEIDKYTGKELSKSIRTVRDLIIALKETAEIAASVDKAAALKVKDPHGLKAMNGGKLKRTRKKRRKKRKRKTLRRK